MTSGIEAQWTCLQLRKVRKIVLPSRRGSKKKKVTWKTTCVFGNTAMGTSHSSSACLYCLWIWESLSAALHSDINTRVNKSETALTYVQHNGVCDMLWHVSIWHVHPRWQTPVVTGEGQNLLQHSFILEPLNGHIKVSTPTQQTINHTHLLLNSDCDDTRV